MPVIDAAADSDAPLCISPWADGPADTEPTVQELNVSLRQLWQDLGGPENLSEMQRALCEGVTFMRRRLREYERAVVHGRTPPFDEGTYTNHRNVLSGYLSKLGLERRARTVRSLRAALQGNAP